MTPFTFNTTSSLVFEAGASRRLGEIIRRLGNSLLLVTDPSLRRLGLCNPALGSLSAAGIAVSVFDEVEADPSLATVMNAAEVGRSAKALARGRGGNPR